MNSDFGQSWFGWLNSDGAVFSAAASEESESDEASDSDDEFEDAVDCVERSASDDNVISLDNQSIVTLIDKKEAEDSKEHRSALALCLPTY